MTKTTTRTDGVFGKLYKPEHEPGDLGRIITEYRKGRKKVSYRRAWSIWFRWAGKKVKE